MSVRFNISLDDKISDELTDFCNEYGLDRSSAISLAVKSHLKQIKLQEQLSKDMHSLIKSLEEFKDESRSLITRDDINDLDSIKALTKLTYTS